MRGQSLLYGTLAAAITLFVWQTISNVAIPWHAATVKAFTSDAAAVQAIRVVAPTNGVYAAPEGILAAVSLTPDMADKSKSMGPNMAKQIVIDLIAALLLSLVVGHIGVGRKRDVALNLGLAGLAAGIIKEMSDWNWYGFSASYAIVNEIDLAIQFALAGIVIAWIYKRGMGSYTAAAVAPGVR
ncbi:MAG: hypothetical protein JWL97_373 [Gemmatimonadales bacterium]|nr:hypothetical protein [Gemmatimonadales bacterium]